MTHIFETNNLIKELILNHDNTLTIDFSDALPLFECKRKINQAVYITKPESLARIQGIFNESVVM